MSKPKCSYFVKALNPDANEALATALNERAESAEHCRCVIAVGGVMIYNVFQIPDHNFLQIINDAGREREFVVYLVVQIQ